MQFEGELIPVRIWYIYVRHVWRHFYCSRSIFQNLVWTALNFADWHVPGVLVLCLDHFDLGVWHESRAIPYAELDILVWYNCYYLVINQSTVFHLPNEILFFFPNVGLIWLDSRKLCMSVLTHLSIELQTLREQFS